jgi:hypothetical protein
VFIFNVAKSSDGLFDFNFSQTDLAGNVSNSVLHSWRRDTQSPLSPTITQPNVNPSINPTDPFVSGDTALVIAGVCEKDSQVNLTGDSAQSMICLADNTYSFSFIDNSINSLNTYDFYLTQTDTAGNISTPSNHLAWVHDTTVPAAPSLTPTEGDYYSPASTLTVYVTCDSTSTPLKNIVHLNSSTVSTVDIINSSAGAGMLDLDCNSSPVFYVIQKLADANHTMNFNQENPNNTTSNNTSAEVSLIWHRDQAAPAAPSIQSPSTSPYTAPGNVTLAGACETNATINVSISETLTTNISTLSDLCVDGAFSFDVVKSDDDTYTFSVTQTDLAGNISPTASLAWIRNSNSLPVPNIASPSSTGDYLSNGSVITLSGGCNSGYTVTLSGTAANANDVLMPYHSLTQTCTVSNTYSFTINKSYDSVFEFSVFQSLNGFDSALNNLIWTRDTVGPISAITVVTQLSSGSTTNLNSSINFIFNSDDSGTVDYSCKLDTEINYTTPCGATKSYAIIDNGSRSLFIYATDSLGNIGSVQTFSWTQAAYKTVALYHLNSLNANPLGDSAPFTANTSFNNSLASSGAVASMASGKFNSAYQMTTSATLNNFLYTLDNETLNTLNSSMTIEGFVKIATQPSANNKYFTLVSKSQTGALGWELQLFRSSSNCYKIRFRGSLNGTSYSTKTAGSCKTLNIGTWYYFAATWNKGTLKLYLNSTTASYSGAIGTVGTSVLKASTASLKLGSGSDTLTSTSSVPLTGSLDEIRISNLVRTITIPSAEYSNPD